MMKNIANQTASEKQRAKQDYWKRLFEEQKNSGLTQELFCLERQIKKSTFQYWKGRLKKESQSGYFLPVTIAPDESSTSLCQASGISLSLGGQITIQLEEQFNSSTLSKLLDFLEAR